MSRLMMKTRNLKRAKDVGHNLNVGVDFVDGSVLLDGTEMSVNQAKCHIKSAEFLKGEAI